MLTGANLSLYFDQKVSASYTGYLDNTKKNRLFKDALIAVVERTYKQNEEVKTWDELTYVTTVSNLFTPSNNVLDTAALQIVGVLPVGATFRITTRLPHNIVTGQVVTISGVAGTGGITNANGTFTATVINATSFSVSFALAAGAYTLNTGIVVTQATISDYWHLLAIKCLFNTPIYGVKVTDATNRTPIAITVNNRNIIRTGSQVVISGVTGNTAANGTFYARVRNDFQFDLYSDVNLQTPVVGTGAYVSGGIVSIVNNNYASPLTSKMKQGVLNTPTPKDPYFEIANDLIKIHPLSQPCTTVKIDYIRVPQVVIDVADAVTDLTLYYPEKFLYAILNEASVIFAQMTRDPELFQEANIDQRKNP